MIIRPTIPGPEAYPFRDHRTLAEVWGLEPVETDSETKQQEGGDD